MALTPLLAALILAPAQENRFTRDLIPVGESAPSFAVDAMSGKVEWKGNSAAVIAFWHVGSRESAGLLADLEGWDKEFGRKLGVYAINVGDPKDRIDQFLRSNSVKLAVGLASGTDEGLKDQFGVKGYPTVYVVSKEGKVVFRDHRPASSAIYEALKTVTE